MVGLAILGQFVANIMELSRRPFPPTVRIETTNHCNASCTFCPRESMGRPKARMDQELFEKIVTECADNDCRRIHMHNFGEPLLDRRLPDRIRYAKTKGLKRIKIFCNGSVLKADMAERLLDSGLDEIKVSIDGSNAQEFNKLRIGLNHAQIVENTRKFREMRDERQLSRPRVIAACTLTSDKRRTKEMLKTVVDRVEYTRLHNWGGARKALLGHMRVRKPCDRLWRTFTILANGDVALCCLDYSGKEILGNCREQSITEIWRNDRYRELRRLHQLSRQDEIPVCKECSKSFY
jgi:radical SAM protein with 4Fe4S-binding SPASM domain